MYPLPQQSVGTICGLEGTSGECAPAAALVSCSGMCDPMVEAWRGCQRPTQD